LHVKSPKGTTMERNRPKNPQVELIEAPITSLLRTKSASERVMIAVGLHRTAKSMVETAVQQRHPEWTDLQIRDEVCRRMLRGHR
jgi:hypothetical protein